MKLSDLSYRLKIPLAISAVIVVTELVVATSLVTRAFIDARSDLETSARNLSAVLARSLREPMVRDDLWQAFEVIRTPLVARTPDNALQSIVVIDEQRRVFVASDPRRAQVTASAEDLPEPLRSLFERTGRVEDFDLLFARGPERREMAASRPITTDDGVRLGTVLVEYDAERYYRRIHSTLVELAVLSLPGLLVLIPLGWYAGKRMAEPLASIAQGLERVGRDPPAQIALTLPVAGRDEIGRLASSARSMLADLARKNELERQVVTAERLAAVGWVSAAMAHEINNPLGGMLNAIDTLGRHGQADALTRKTLGLLERGLNQIRATVGALLVEARRTSTSLESSDWADLRLLIEPHCTGRGLSLVWELDASLQGEIPLPSHEVRQVVLNLLLNAANAATAGSAVALEADGREGMLTIRVTNAGPTLAPDRIARLFQPFDHPWSNDSPSGGLGLGLWVCNQLVTRRGGQISATSAEGLTRFEVRLPFPEGTHPCAPTPPHP